MDSYIKLLSHKKLYYVVLGYLLKDKYMKEVLSEMYIITTSSTQEIIIQNKCQMMFLENLLLKRILNLK